MSAKSTDLEEAANSESGVLVEAEEKAPQKKGGRSNNNTNNNNSNSSSSSAKKTANTKGTLSSMPRSSCGKPEMTWNVNRRHHHLRWVFPSGKQGMQASLHRDVIKRLQPIVVTDTEDYVIAARRILHRQRVAGKLLPRFTRAKSANHVTGIAQALKDAQPAQIDMEHVNKLLHTSQAYQAPVFPGRRYTAEDVDRITERLSTYDPEKVPESRGYAVKFQLPVMYRKQQQHHQQQQQQQEYSEEEVYDIVKRLSSYDPEKCPPESKPPGAVPIVITARCRQSLGKSHVKKCSAEQVQEIVNRLSSGSS